MSTSPLFSVDLPSDDLCLPLGYPRTETISTIHKQILSAQLKGVASFASHDVLHALQHNEQETDSEDGFEIGFLDLDPLDDDENSHFPYLPCKSAYYSASDESPYDENERYGSQTDERWLQFYRAAKKKNEWILRTSTSRTDALHDNEFALYEHAAQDKGKGKEKERTCMLRSPFASTLDNNSKADRTFTFEKYSTNDETFANLLSSFRHGETSDHTTTYPHYVIAGPSRIKIEDLVWYR